MQTQITVEMIIIIVIIMKTKMSSCHIADMRYVRRCHILTLV